MTEEDVAVADDDAAETTVKPEAAAAAIASTAPTPGGIRLISVMQALALRLRDHM